MVGLLVPSITGAVTIEDDLKSNPFTTSVDLVALTPSPEIDYDSTPSKPVKQEINQTPAATPVLSADKEEVAKMVIAEFGEGNIMYWVALNESDFNPYAASGTGPVGVFQIAGSTWTAYGCTGSRVNAADNIQCARKIYDTNGLTDWRWSKYAGYNGGWGKNLTTAVL